MLIRVNSVFISSLPVGLSVFFVIRMDKDKGGWHAALFSFMSLTAIAITRQDRRVVFTITCDTGTSGDAEDIICGMAMRTDWLVVKIIFFIFRALFFIERSC